MPGVGTGGLVGGGAGETGVTNTVTVAWISGVGAVVGASWFPQATVQVSKAIEIVRTRVEAKIRRVWDMVGTPFAARIGLPATVAGLHLCAKQRGHDAQAFEMAHIRGPYLKTLDCGRSIQPQRELDVKEVCK